jgi:hypothetical protein
MRKMPKFISSKVQRSGLFIFRWGKAKAKSALDSCFTEAGELGS